MIAWAEYLILILKMLKVKYVKYDILLFIVFIIAVTTSIYYKDYSYTMTLLVILSFFYVWEIGTLQYKNKLNARV